MRLAEEPARRPRLTRQVVTGALRLRAVPDPTACVVLGEPAEPEAKQAVVKRLPFRLWLLP
jgi:hypothetical protein